MTITAKEFLKNIGSRPLTDQEIRELHILRIREGDAGLSGFLDAFDEAEAEENKEKIQSE